MKPRKSLVNGWEPTRTLAKSYSGPMSNSFTSANHSCSVVYVRLRVVPRRTSGLTTASSETSRWFTLNAGVTLTRQSIGLKAASPWKRSKLTNSGCV